MIVAYKRYIKRNGKVYGPYIYKSIRDKKGDVKSEYAGKAEPEPAKKTRFTLQGIQGIQRNLFLILFIVLIVIGGILFIVCAL